MSTLKHEDFEVMNTQIEMAKDKMIDKQKVLFILHEKLKEVDSKNELIVDRIDGVVLKNIINEVIKL